MDQIHSQVGCRNVEFCNLQSQVLPTLKHASFIKMYSNWENVYIYYFGIWVGGERRSYKCIFKALWMHKVTNDTIKRSEFVFILSHYSSAKLRKVVFMGGKEHENWAQAILEHELMFEVKHNVTCLRTNGFLNHIGKVRSNKLLKHQGLYSSCQIIEYPILTSNNLWPQ